MLMEIETFVSSYIHNRQDKKDNEKAVRRHARSSTRLGER